MKKKFQKIIIFLLALFLFFVLVVFIGNTNTEQVFAQGRELEVEYPEIEGLKPETVEFPLTNYVKYIFNFFIWASGFIALCILVYGGFKYLTSTGKPENLKVARNQILAAFWGIIILLSAYLILITINPQLVLLQIPRLRLVPPEPISLPPLVPKAPILYKNIKEIAEQVLLISAGIEDSAQEIKELTDDCNCGTTQPLCLCDGGSDSSSCNPIKCYSEDNTQPCPDESKIKKEQQDIIAFRFEIIYYKNRAVAERESLLLEIDQLTEEKNYFQERENDEIEILNTIPAEKGIARENQQRIINELREKKEELEEEIRLRGDLAGKLQRLVDLINDISSPASEIGQLPDKCLYDEEGEYGVNNVCQPRCKGECHDYKSGCQPDGCDGGNPCPTGDIDTQLSDIKSLSGNLEVISNEIISSVEDIIVFKT